MVTFSKKEDYAVILIYALAKAYNTRVIPLSEVASENKLSLLFLRKVAFELRKANIIKATEGKYGGYMLSHDPSLLLFGTILEALNTKPLFSCCQKTKDGKCSASSCPHGPSLNRIKNSFLKKLCQLSVSEFIEYKTL